MTTNAYEQGLVTSTDDVHRVIAEYDAEHPAPSHYDRRMRERAEEEARKVIRAKEVEAARRNAAQWSAWAATVNQSLANAAQRLNSIEAVVLPADCRDGANKHAGLATIIGHVFGEIEAKLRRKSRR